MRRQMVFLGALALLAGCAAPDAGVPEHASGAFIRDTARVVSIDPALGQVVLDLHGRQVHAFWQTEVEMAQGGTIAQPDPTGLKLPVGQYRAPVVREQTITAAEGDTIHFLGMWTDSQIFLRSVAIVKP